MSLIRLIRDSLSGKFMAFGMAASALMFVSCADVYDSDEQFSSDVRNTTLLSPNADDITVTASTDGTQTTLEWPVVHGAKGYMCSVYDVSDAENPVAVVENKLVDGCTLTVARAEDSNYEFVIQTIGREDLNNKDAETATTKAYTSFVSTFASIPTGTDLYQYFLDNPLPEEMPEGVTELPFDLEPGGQYTVSGILDFGNHNVTLRCTDKGNRANIVYGVDATIRTSAPMALKNINFDCSASKKEAVGLSETPDESIKKLTGTGDYYNIMAAVFISNCDFKGVNGRFFFDNEKKYCLETLLISNCLVQFTPAADASISGNAYIHFKSGFANTLNIKNSTFYAEETGTEAKYFVQYNNSARCDRAGYLKNYVIHSNCTFYNIATQKVSGQWANYSGFSGRATSTFELTNCIFANCAKEVARRFIAGRYADAMTMTFANNTYMFDMTAGEEGCDKEDGYDKSGTAIKTAPDFVNPSAGDFTLTSSEQAQKRTGDPRWLPEAVTEN